MRANSQVPKTFIIVIKSEGKDKYLRHKSVVLQDGTINTLKILVSSQKDASHFINFENTKSIAQAYLKKLGCDEIGVFDEKTGKMYHVQKHQQATKEV